MPEYLYAGLTIGPIYSMSCYARATKEHWLASYMFSRYAQRLIISLSDSFANSPCADFLLLSPGITPEEARSENPVAPLIQKDERVGLYSDRIFFRLSKAITREPTDTSIDTAVEAANQMIADMMCQVLNHSRTNHATIENCLACVKKTLYVCRTYRLSDRILLREMNATLDALELFAGDQDWEMDGETDYWAQLFDKNKLTAHACGWIAETSLRGADISQVAGRNRPLYQETQASRYYAVVVADGDSMGKLLGLTMHHSECDWAVREISRKLLHYCAASANAVVEYGDYAYPVYFGGDDMEFFVPLFGTAVKENSAHPKDIFDLISDLNQIFQENFAPSISDGGILAIQQVMAADNQCSLSLSVGVNIVYYKYPLDRAIREAHDALARAKSARYAGGVQKDSVCIRLRKHSGQQSEALIHKHGMERSESCGLEEIPRSPWMAVSRYMALHASEQILHAIHYKLILQREVLVYLLMLDDPERDTRLRCWLNKLQEESPISQRYLDTLCAMLARLWDSREKTPTNEENAALWEKKRYLSTLDGVFRLGEIMHTYTKPVSTKEVCDACGT